MAPTSFMARQRQRHLVSARKRKGNIVANWSADDEGSHSGAIVKSTVSKEARKDFVLLAITSIAAAIGMRSVFAAILSDDRAFAVTWPWITRLFPRRTTA